MKSPTATTPNSLNPTRLPHVRSHSTSDILVEEEENVSNVSVDDVSFLSVPNLAPQMVPDVASTPISATPTIEHIHPMPSSPALTPVVVVKDYSILDYVWAQITSSEYADEETTTSKSSSVSLDLKKERIENFLNVPIHFEKLIALGYLICLDSFLYTFTILPLRILYAIWCLPATLFRRSSQLRSSQKSDLVKALLLAVSCFLLESVDGSRLYHSVRGQSTIKLYVIFNMLEIFDKLLCAIGHDILDSLFNQSSAASLGSLHKITHLFLALAYILGHTIILFFQVMALNVAINSHNNTLFSLLLSNQFIEIKGNVFKRFERENLFQLACADIVERFQLSVFLLIICIRNLVELTGLRMSQIVSLLGDIQTATYTYSTALVSTIQSGKMTDVDFNEHLRQLRNATSWVASYLSTDSTSYYTPNLLWSHIFGPALAVLATELLVDWLKHAFITKFNALKVSTIYPKYRETLVRDMCVVEPHTVAYADRSPAVARRIGFLGLPLACLVVRVVSQTWRMICSDEKEGTELLACGTRNFRAFPPEPYVSDFWVEMTGCASSFTWDEAGLRLCWERQVTILKLHQDSLQAWVVALSSTVGLWLLLGMCIYFTLLVCKLLVGYTLLCLTQRELQNLTQMQTPIRRKPSGTMSVKNFREESNNQRGNDLEVDIVQVDRDEKLDRVDRFLMVKSRIV